MNAVRHYRRARSVVWIGIAWGLIGVVFAADGLSVLVATVLAARVKRHIPVYAAAYVVQGVA